MGNNFPRGAHWHTHGQATSRSGLSGIRNLAAVSEVRLLILSASKYEHVASHTWV